MIMMMYMMMIMDDHWLSDDASGLEDHVISATEQRVCYA